MGGGEGEGEHRPPRPAHQGGAGGSTAARSATWRATVSGAPPDRRCRGSRTRNRRPGPGPAGPSPPAPPDRRGAGPPPGRSSRSGAPRSARRTPADGRHPRERIRSITSMLAIESDIGTGQRERRRGRRRRRPRPGAPYMLAGGKGSTSDGSKGGLAATAVEEHPGGPVAGDVERDLQGDPALAAVDHHPLVGLGPDGDAERGQAIAELEHPRHQRCPPRRPGRAAPPPGPRWARRP